MKEKGRMMKCSNGLFPGSLDDRYKNRGEFIAFSPQRFEFWRRNNLSVDKQLEPVSRLTR
jgi:hypothetical protein